MRGIYNGFKGGERVDGWRVKGAEREKEETNMLNGTRKCKVSVRGEYEMVAGVGGKMKGSVDTGIRWN